MCFTKMSKGHETTTVKRIVLLKVHVIGQQELSWSSVGITKNNDKEKIPYLQ